MYVCMYIKCIVRVILILCAISYDYKESCSRWI